MKDNQGNEIILNGAYLFIYAQPGNDTTTLVVTKINEDGTVDAYDVCFKFNLKNIKPDDLFKPLKYGWEQRPQDRISALEYGATL